jgi:hypothetical protein
MRILWSTLLGFVVAVSAQAGELAGVTLPDQAEAGGQTLVLNGMALRSKFFVKVYVAGLYLPAKEGDGAKVLSADGPRRLTMHWVRSVGKQAICDGWYEGLAANTPDAGADLKRDFDTLCAWMSDVGSGDRFVFTYLPATGTTVEVRGQAAGTLPGKAFADALWACWIGPQPGPGEEFKQALLGG